MTTMLETEPELASPGSYLARLLSVGPAHFETFTGTRDSYDRLTRCTPPADLISPTDTADQMLLLLALDTARRAQLQQIASDHGWPAPCAQPWDAFVHDHLQDS